MQTQLETPSLRRTLGGARAVLERVFDDACALRTDDRVLREIADWERAGRIAAPMPVSRAALARPHIFWALFRRAYNGVSTSRDMAFEASQTVPDGVSGKTWGVADLCDPSHYVSQSTASLQFAIPSADSGFGGAPAAQLPNSATYAYVSNKAASAFAFLHQAGCTSAHVLAWTRYASIPEAVIVSTCDGFTPAHSGVWDGLSFGAGYKGIVMTMNAAPVEGPANGRNVITILGDMPENVPTLFTKFQGATTARLRVRSTEFSQTITGPYSAANPANTMRMFDSMPATPRQFTGRWGGSYYFRRELTEPEFTILQARTLARFAVPLV